MDHRVGAPAGVALRFVECINRGGVEGIAALMAEDYVLRVFDEAPQHGRDEGAAGWRGYARAFPAYLIHPHCLAVKGGQVAILGHTTGSHLGLPDAEECKLTLIWIVGVAVDRIASWTPIADTPSNRGAWDLDASGPGDGG